MTEPIRIDPAVLRRVADQHEDVADQIAAARAAGEEISAAVAGYGPIMHQVKAAAADVLADRDTALRRHEDAHRATADALRAHAANVVATDEDNARRLRL
jgi:hypothetical protein